MESCSEEDEEFSYEHMLEESILCETRAFYSDKCRDWFRSMSCRDYCRTVKDALDAEEQLCQTCIPLVSHQPIRMVRTFGFGWTPSLCALVDCERETAGVDERQSL